MAQIELRQVTKKFGEAYAVKPVDLTINDGEFVVLLGPSGCGKTTTLRMISGLEAVSSGQILINGRDVTWNHPSDRDIAFVFQFFALYPHMTVRQNIAFTLEAQKVVRSEVDQRVGDVAKLLQIEHLLHRRPKALSGGDKQRVALARALVRRPAAFLMDEPLGALDADFRAIMRAEIKRLHLAQHATTVYVTHDQIEAMAMSDRIVVMSAAVVQQVGTPAQVYYDPANLFVARFIGSPGMNLISGQLVNGVVQLPGGNQYTPPEQWRNRLAQQLSSDEVILGFRPEAARIKADGTLKTQVYADDLYGAYSMLHLALDGEQATVMAHIRAERDSSHKIGQTLGFDLEPSMVRFFDPKTELAVAVAEKRTTATVTPASTAKPAKTTVASAPPLQANNPKNVGKSKANTSGKKQSKNKQKKR
ncbi:MAG: ATP-binding cassette domain-containing protein [Caldilinea sp. CFX5]|nr:ATP-binding cassette domain-containing protein [Caldilinea sp. CFX5]